LAELAWVQRISGCGEVAVTTITVANRADLRRFLGNTPGQVAAQRKQGKNSKR
jgi:hypothetical protein